ncbi:MAG: Lrp/AsnC ligand binding domain-containing protein, partial [Nitrosopumilaceae archaeon]
YDTIGMRFCFIEAHKLVQAYIIMNCDPNTEGSVEKTLKSIPEVKESKTTYGAYDIVVKVEAKTDKELKETVSKIRKIGNIRSVITMLITR